MTTAIALFGAFEEYEVRWNGDLENPEWIAQDVAAVLGIGNYRQVVSRYPDNYQGVTSSDGLDGKNREMLTLTEPGLYRMIFASRKPEAEKFRAWVFEKVLPSIRKTGGYAAMQHLQAQIDDLKSMVQQLLVREASPQENRPISPSTPSPHPPLYSSLFPLLRV
ncbi:MAG: hypothetical protein HC769_33050 [Cyanobacteria bacterium CRU_2_1]|nr:hypothetical protein [Cyanobacteria bacterium CRU_2_1]